MTTPFPTSPIDYSHELHNGWSRYEVMVLTELKRIGDGLSVVSADVQEIKEWKAASEAVDKRKNRLSGVALQWAAVAIALVSSISTIVWLVV